MPLEHTTRVEKTKSKLKIHLRREEKVEKEPGVVSICKRKQRMGVVSICKRKQRKRREEPLR